MIVFKKTNCGFTLIEVLLAIALVGMLLVPIFIVQTSLLLNTHFVADQLHDFFAHTVLLAQARKDQKETDRTFIVEEKIDANFGYVYELGVIHKDSILADIPELLIEKVTTKRTVPPLMRKKSSNHLVTFIFKPERNSDAKKGSGPS